MKSILIFAMVILVLGMTACVSDPWCEDRDQSGQCVHKAVDIDDI